MSIHLRFGFRFGFHHEVLLKKSDAEKMSSKTQYLLKKWGVKLGRPGVLEVGSWKGNQWVFISLDHKVGYFWGGVRGPGGGRLTSHDIVIGVSFRALSNCTKMGALPKTKSKNT